MEKRERIGLVVRVLFEPNRIADNCLEEAYERLIPAPWTTTRARAPSLKEPTPQPTEIT